MPLHPLESLRGTWADARDITITRHHDGSLTASEFPDTIILNLELLTLIGTLPQPRFRLLEGGTMLELSLTNGTARYRISDLDEARHCVLATLYALALTPFTPSED